MTTNMRVCHICQERVPLKDTIQRWVYEGDPVSYGDLFKISEKPKVTLRKVRVCKTCA